jgi:protein-L-isoaspartate(D-aspartate) O-methyltransferase
LAPILRARVDLLVHPRRFTPSRRLKRATLLVVAMIAVAGAAQAGARVFESERAAMVGRLRRQRITNPRVLDAMSKVPRHLFVEGARRNQAYDDTELSLGGGQVMASPYVTALMAQVLDPQPGARLLEVGTGSGYLSAVLSQITPNVYTVDMRADLARSAQTRLRSLKYTQVTFRSGDACQGWAQQGPFDGIVVNCAAEAVPEPLIAQLKNGGRLVIPIGQGPEQTLNCMRKSGGKLRCETIMSIRVSPMVCQRHR